MTVVWNVRRAVPADAEALLALEQQCLEAPHWSKAIWERLLAQEDGTDFSRACLFAEDYRGVQGFVVTSCTRGIAELDSVVVDAAARRHGIGRLLCNEAMIWSRERKAQVIELEVRASNVGAIALYVGLGFTEQGRRPGYYREPTDDAVLMSATLASDLP